MQIRSEEQKTDLNYGLIFARKPHCIPALILRRRTRPTDVRNVIIPPLSITGMTNNVQHCREHNPYIHNNYARKLMSCVALPFATKIGKKTLLLSNNLSIYSKRAKITSKSQSFLQSIYHV